MIHLDTHVAIWLHDRRVRNIPQSVRRLIEREIVVISYVSLLEYEILLERGRVDTPTATFLKVLEDMIDLSLSDTALAAIVERARSFAWTRDPFDRLIVANAMADGARLVTADGDIRANFQDAVWAD